MSKLTKRDRWKLDSTVPNINFPTTVAIVGMISAPQRTRVTDMGSLMGVLSEGVLKLTSVDISIM